MYTTYEKLIINRLIEMFPDLAPSLGRIVERLVDLHPINPETTPERKAELEEQLLRYCRFDTEAIVKIVRLLTSVNLTDRLM